MILADTSVWIRHFREGDPRFQQLLSHGEIRMHPFVLGELACGNLRDRNTTLRELQTLPAVAVANDSDVYYVLESRRLWGKGLGWIDLHLLASALISGVRLWTHDQALGSAAVALHVAF
ncbi:MAG: type II toxin-antitoxin system VapC family toxin [Acidobacteria bacterium]|nr:type II toxin-antitoxin system VapC family toxin [Acidobacteriota bacterium]